MSVYYGEQQPQAGVGTPAGWTWLGKPPLDLSCSLRLRSISQRAAAPQGAGHRSFPRLLVPPGTILGVLSSPDAPAPPVLSVPAQGSQHPAGTAPRESSGLTASYSEGFLLKNNIIYSSCLLKGKFAATSLSADKSL